jgi:prepilin-type processing-associated H-X9-DG protein/prepilin-type N-terminal cleavage/methylation domain-containing protein
MHSPRIHSSSGSSRQIPLSGGDAFTLVELLAVIVIIGILVAIIIPVAGHVRESARTATCQSNLRQIGHTLQVFLNDSKQRLPVALGSQPNGTTGAWDYTLLLYHVPESRAQETGILPHGIFACPSTNRRSRGIASASSFAINLNISDARWGPVLMPIDTIPAPSRTYFATDSDQREFYHSNKSLFETPGTNITKAAKDRHRGRLNMLFVDGSVKAIDIDRMPWMGNQHNIPWGYR